MQSIIFPRDFDPTIVLWRRAKEPSKTGYIEPGSLWENGYCESFYGRMRDELLNGEIFCSLHEAQIIIERWRTSYTTKGLHAPSSRWTRPNSVGLFTNAHTLADSTFWCMSAPSTPVVRHSRQSNRIAIRFRTLKPLFLLTARIDWCLGKEVNLRMGVP